MADTVLNLDLSLSDDASLSMSVRSGADDIAPMVPRRPQSAQPKRRLAAPKRRPTPPPCDERTASSEHILLAPSQAQNLVPVLEEELGLAAELDEEDGVEEEMVLEELDEDDIEEEHLLRLAFERELFRSRLPASWELASSPNPVQSEASASPAQHTLLDEGNMIAASVAAYLERMPVETSLLAPLAVSLLPRSPRADSFDSFISGASATSHRSRADVSTPRSIPREGPSSSRMQSRPGSPVPGSSRSRSASIATIASRADSSPSGTSMRSVSLTGSLQEAYRYELRERLRVHSRSPSPSGSVSVHSLGSASPPRTRLRSQSHLSPPSTSSSLSSTPMIASPVLSPGRPAPSSLIAGLRPSMASTLRRLVSPSLSGAVSPGSMEFWPSHGMPRGLTGLQPHLSMADSDSEHSFVFSEDFVREREASPNRSLPSRHPEGTVASFCSSSSCKVLQDRMEAMERELKQLQGRQEALQTLSVEELHSLMETLRSSSSQVQKELTRKQTQDELLCIICMTDRKEVLVQPCNHISMCRQCFQRSRAKCPQCRGRITGHMRVYF